MLNVGWLTNVKQVGQVSSKRPSEWSDKWNFRAIAFTRAATEAKILQTPVQFVLDNYQKLFMDKESSGDVTIKASDGIELHVHKLILASQSSVFNTMFNIDMTEKSSAVVEIKDFDSKVLTELFRFMYCGEVETNEEINCEILRAAKRYEIDGLPKICENFIIENFKGVEIWEALEVAHVFNLEELFTFIGSIFFV